MEASALFVKHKDNLSLSSYFIFVHFEPKLLTTKLV